MKIIAEVPATSANCCVGFDSLGMAVDELAYFHFETAEQLEICGCPEEFQNSDNLVVQSFLYVCQKFNKSMPHFRLTIDSSIPSARGLGSSSTCVVAGILAANLWFHLNLTDDQLLEIAASIEGHPDNVAPALFGSMSACFMENGKIIRARIDCDEFTTLAVIPPYEVSTAKARKVLPKELEFSKAVKQTGRALVFEKAISSGDEKLLFESCQDYLHEPYRKALIPDYETIHAVAQRHQLPFWISGSGPTMLILSKDADKLKVAKEEVEALFPSFDLRILPVRKAGAKAHYE